MNLPDACPVLSRFSVFAFGFALVLLAGWPVAPAQAAVMPVASRLASTRVRQKRFGFMEGIRGIPPSLWRATPA